MDSRLAHLGDGLHVSGSLFAASDERKPVSIGPRQGLGGHRAGSGRPDGGDLTGVDDADGRAGFGVEQNDKALVGLFTLRRIFLEDRNKFRAEWRMCAQCARHHSEQVSFG